MKNYATMSEPEIKRLQDRIDRGILLAQKRLIEKTKRENGQLVIFRDGKVLKISAKDLQ